MTADSPLPMPFLVADRTGYLCCIACGAFVPPELHARHVEWHERTNTR